MKRVFLQAVVLAVAAWAAPASAQEEIRIGLVEPITGSVAYNGNSVVEGAKLAISEVNAAGGILGKQVRLVIEDGQCQPANSVNAVEKLVQKDKVALLVGAFCSSATAAIMPVALKYKIPLITAVSSKADLTETRDAADEVRREMKARGIDLHVVSAVSGEGMKGLLEEVWKRLKAP